METRKQGHIETQAWRHGYEEWTWKHGINITGNSVILPKNKKENGSQGDFSQSVSHLLIVQTEVCFVCLFVDEKTNGSYPFANGLNGLPMTSTNTYNTSSQVRYRPPIRGDQVPKCSMYGKGN
jgi:hypothetical protein